MQIRLLLLAMLSIFLVMGLASSEQDSLGVFKQNTPINLVQTCSNCTFNNISFIQSPNSSIIVTNKDMTKVGTAYNYTLAGQSLLGNYVVCGFGDPDSLWDTWCYDFMITPTGNRQDTSQSIISLGLIGILALMGLAFGTLGVYLFGKKNLWFYGVLVGVLGFILIAYTLSTAVGYQRDLAYFSTNGHTVEKSFTTFINVTKYILLFSIPMFIWLGYEAIKKRKSEFTSEDGWDNNNY